MRYARSRNTKLKTAAILMSSLLAISISTFRAAAQQSGSSGSDQTQQTAPPADNNSFPEDISRKAARDAAAKKKMEDKQAATGDDQSSSDQAGSGQAAPSAQNSSSDSNAFPEETSRKAADAARTASSGSSADTSGSDVPANSGSSSSSDYDRRAGGGRNDAAINAPMPHLNGKDPVKEDVEVGTLYLQMGNFPGAYQRFKEASTLAPENADAMFGLAEAARHLKKRDEALANYQLFLQVVTSGSKAKDARKAVASLEKDK
jgi:tetratricopeptide (TPR) repeat protein